MERLGRRSSLRIAMPAKSVVTVGCERSFAKLSAIDVVRDGPTDSNSSEV
jgi:hypothetical protein